MSKPKPRVWRAGDRDPGELCLRVTDVNGDPYTPTGRGMWFGIEELAFWEDLPFPLTEVFPQSYEPQAAKTCARCDVSYRGKSTSKICDECRSDPPHSPLPKRNEQVTGVTRTLLRHRMLHAISTGRVDRAKHGWEIRSSASLYKLRASAVEHLIHGGAARIDSPPEQAHGPVVATDKGRELLAAWDDKYGPVTQ